LLFFTRFIFFTKALFKDTF